VRKQLDEFKTSMERKLENKMGDNPTTASSVPVAVETPSTTTAEDGALSTAVKSSEYQAIMAAIRSSSNRSEAAKKLGISPRSLRYKMAQFRDRGLPLLAAA
jgi:two-component system response regulator FlrC